MGGAPVDCRGGGNTTGGGLPAGGAGTVTGGVPGGEPGGGGNSVGQLTWVLLVVERREECLVAGLLYYLEGAEGHPQPEKVVFPVHQVRPIHATWAIDSDGLNVIYCQNSSIPYESTVPGTLPYGRTAGVAIVF